MIRFVLKPSRNIRQWFGDKAAVVSKGVFRAMTEQMLKLTRYIRTEKLSGQVLKNRTGTLRRAIFMDVIEKAGGNIVTGNVMADRSVPYARIHEYGGKIRIPAVKGKLMVFERDGQTIFTMKHRAFTVRMPERSYMRTSLAELRDDINAALVQAVRESL